MIVQTHDEAVPSTRRQTLFDVALALGCLALVLPISLSGLEAVPANRPPGPLLVVLTVIAVGPIAWRRHRPLTVLVITLLAVLTMVVTRTTVGLSTLGPLVAVYTAVAYASSRTRAHVATWLLLAAFAAAAVLDPVDLSVEGTVVQGIVFAGGWLLANATRVRADTERERVQRVATEERLRISRDVHDIVGHALSVMIVQAAVAEQLIDDQPARAREAVVEIGRTGRASLADIRRLLGVLHATDPDALGVPASGSPTLEELSALADGIRAAGLPVDLRTTGPVADAPSGLALAAYRVVQEALTNSLRHAGAGSATVRVQRSADQLEVWVDDDGTPSGPLADETVATDDVFRPGHGLTGMRERVRVYGGTLSVGLGPDGGTRVHATFPLPGVGRAVETAAAGRRA